MRRTTLLTTLLTVAFALLSVGAASAAVPRSFFGLEAKDIFAFGQSYRDGELPKVADAGIGLIRQEFNWASIEPQAGQYNWTTTDGLVGDAAKRGIEVMPMLIDPPAFRASHPKGADGGIYPPKNYADLGDFGAAVVRRYGPNGSFWAEHPTIPKVPFHHYELWNEPNLPRFWEPAVNAGQYVAMVKAAVPRIRAADPTAEMVAAGISEPRNPCCVAMRTYIAEMYAAGLRGSVDSIALHPYWETAEGVVTLVEAARQIMADNGDSASGVWITEIGWATGGPTYSYSTDEAGQAQRLRDLYTTLVRRRCQLRVKGVVWAMWRDHPPPNEWTQYTGLERQDGSAKPAYDAYRGTAALGGPTCNGELSRAPGASGHDFVGVNAPELASASSGARNRSIRLQAKVGVGLVRQVVNWRSIESRRGRYRLGGYDRLVMAAAERGIVLLPVITNAPRRYRSLRSRQAGIAKLATALAKRYGPRGSLWRAHPGSARYPIRSWEIWQNPNLSAGGYVALLRAARRAIRREDRGAEIVTAALSRSFASAVYRAGGKSAFDVLAIAPYARTPAGVLSQARAARRLMVRHRDRAAKLWIVSFGWSDRGPRSQFRAGSKGQAAKVRQALRLFARNRRALALRGVIYVAWRDKASSGPAWTRYAGLLDTRRREKPAFRAFRAGVQNLP